eukprot:1159460-Pelagomonas_calceolata.AAC.3
MRVRLGGRGADGCGCNAVLRGVVHQQRAIRKGEMVRIRRKVFWQRKLDVRIAGLRHPELGAGRRLRLQ